MLNCYLKNKAFLEPKNEDAKTSMVFERLLHLPSELVWKIIRDSCCSTVPAEYSDAGKILSYEFWPKYDVIDKLGQKTADNKNYVEPDLVIKFENFTLIIEAKEKDNQGYVQSPEQWGKELNTYRNENGFADKVVMLAVGGNTDLQTFELVDQNHSRVPVLKATWNRMLQTIYFTQRNSSDVDQLDRIFNALKSTFRFFGNYYIHSWPEDIQAAGINSESNIKVNELWEIKHIKKNY